MKLSAKPKTFFQNFSSFLKSTLNLEQFQKKHDSQTDLFWKLRTPNNMVRSMLKKSRFGVSVEKQHGICPQTLFTFEGWPLYHIY